MRAISMPGRTEMQTWQRRLYRLAPLISGGISLGVLQAIEGIDFNAIWFQFITLVLSTFVSLFFGGDVSQLGSLRA